MAVSGPNELTEGVAILHTHVFVNDGVPANGTFNGVAPVGALCINNAAVPGLYQNTGTRAATVWTAIFQHA